MPATDPSKRKMAHDHDHKHKPSLWKRLKKGRKPVIPVTVLTGFLGSGKTTLLNHILNDTSHGMKFAIVENELGSVGIDQKVLSENVDEEIIEVMNGCICCSFRGDLVKSLTNLYKKVKNFDGVIIETTGLADPAPVVQTFFVDDKLQKMYKLDSVITVVDAKYILSRLDEKKPDGTVNEAAEQLAFADKVLINKIDLVEDDTQLQAIETRVRGLNPTATMLRCQHSQVSPAELLNIEAFSLERVLEFDPKFMTDNKKPKHDKTVSYTACKLDGEVNVVLLQNWIERLINEDGANLFRYKGVIAVKGMDAKFVFQGVGMLFSGGFEGQWKEGEKRESRFVFIGKNLDHALLRSGFEACQVVGKLRFDVGTTVEANVGDWEKGVIVAHWNEGNAYRIRLDKGGEEVWAPVDVDNYVRAPQ